MYKCLIMGAGNKGAMADIPGKKTEHKYLSYAHAINDNKSCELIGFYDVDKEKEDLANYIWRYNLKTTKDNPDIIIIATPDNKHHISLYQALLYKPKLVILEKPVPLNLKIAYEIGDEYKRRNIPILLDYTRRFIPFWQDIKKQIKNDSYGKFRYGHLVFNRGLYHTASHFADLALWLTGGHEIFAECNDVSIHHDTDLIEVNEIYRWVFSWYLFFEKDFINENAIELKQPNITMYDNHMKYVIENAVNFLQNGEELLCTYDDGLRVNKFLEYKKACGIKNV